MTERVGRIAANRHSLEIGQDLLEQSKRRRHACWRNLLTPLDVINQHPENARAMFSFGGSLVGLSDKGVSGLAAALANAHAFTQELVDRLRNGNRSVSEAA
jgi:hypothetical protein